MSLPLAGVRVLDLSRVLSGPYASMILADLGADVVKVERPGTGDDTRAFGPPFQDGVSTYFLSINRGKRSVTLDLKAEADRQLLYRLADRADVVLENFRPQVMDRLGFGYQALRERNPRLVYCSISGYGRSRPDPGYDLVIQGRSGIPSVTGPGGEPVKCGASIGDLVAGMNAVQGIVAALYRREGTGEGGRVDVPMLDGLLSLLTYHASGWLNQGARPVARGNAHPSIHPFCTYQTQDGWLNLAIGNDALFRKLCRVLEVAWDEDERFGTNGARVGNREAFDRLLAPILAEKASAHWVDCFGEAGIPCGTMATVPEALEGATVATHRHPNGQGEVKTLALGFQLDDLPRFAKLGPPGLGAHREEVLHDWLGE